MFRLQWSNSSGDLRSPSELVVRRLQGTEAPWPTQNVPQTVPSPIIRRKQIPITLPQPTTFFQNTSMLQRIDPRMNNTNCMSCGKGGV